MKHRHRSLHLLVLLVLGLSTGFVAQVLPAQQPRLPHQVTDGWADLRNSQVLAADPAAAARGRSILEDAARRHGFEAWQQKSTAEIIGTDLWAKPGPWWPAQNQRLRLVQLLGTFTSQASLLDGPASGQVWGVQSWQPYSRPAAGAAPELATEPRPTQEFYLPTLHYFNELPFRLLQATTIVDAGTAHLHDDDYHLVFVTWGDPAPRAGVDHYVLWINTASGLVEKAHYTVRDAAELSTVPEEQRPAMRAAATGTIHFRDFREVDGVHFPFEQVVTVFGPQQAPEDPTTAALHTFDVESVRFDVVPKGDLIVDSQLPAPGDRKAAGLLSEP